MFERTPDYEAAYIGEFPTFAENSGPALKWAFKKAEELECEVTVVAPTKRHFSEDEILSSLYPKTQCETPQTLRRFATVQPVVVCFWPEEKSLEQIDNMANLRALAVVPWLEKDITVWRQARGAVDLLGRHGDPEPPQISDPVVEEALRSLTQIVNLSTGIAHPQDRSMAIHAFKILKRNGHAYDPEEIHTWAMANGWAAKDARELSDYAAGVLSVKAYRAGPSAWKKQIIRTWRKAAKQGE